MLEAHPFHASRRICRQTPALVHAGIWKALRNTRDQPDDAHRGRPFARSHPSRCPGLRHAGSAGSVVSGLSAASLLQSPGAAFGYPPLWPFQFRYRSLVYACTQSTAGDD